MLSDNKNNLLQNIVELSEWLLFNANSAIFQLWREQVNFNEMMSTLFYTNTISWIFTVLARWNNSSRIDMSPHSDTFSWFRANQSLPFLLNASCLAKIQQIPILQCLVWPNRGSNPQNTALKASALTITPSIRFIVEVFWEFCRMV